MSGEQVALFLVAAVTTASVLYAGYHLGRLVDDWWHLRNR